MPHASKASTRIVVLALALTGAAGARSRSALGANGSGARRAPKTTRPHFPAPAPLPEGPVAALQKFERLAIPEPPTGRAGIVRASNESHVNHRRSTGPRPSALNPPAPLSTAIRATAATSRQVEAVTQRWKTKLKLPDLPIRWDRKLVRYLQFYRNDPKGRAILALWLQRMGRYERMIRQELQRQGLPQSLIYVAMIESGFDPLQTSPVGAAGLWQFMVPTGADYGLDRDHWVDERRNPELSTRAALRFLKNLYERLGSWELALAAYNAGFGTVLEAMRKYNTNDYWRLCRYEAGLPWSTVLYVPKILATAIVGTNRAAFGFDKIRPDPPLEFELAAVPVSATLRELSDAAGVAPERMLELNPELRRGRTPPYPRVWVRVPAGTKHRFYAFLEPLRRRRFKPYVVKLGDTDRSIAARYGMSWRKLRALNKLSSAAELHPGLTIFVPASEKPSPTTTATGAKPTAASTKVDARSAAGAIACGGSNHGRGTTRARVLQGGAGEIRSLASRGI
jgi:membrane-bound lytic murein transglycosylase D